MYEKYYHMKNKAFPGQPTPSVFFESPVHMGAMRFLRAGVEGQEPFLLVLGRYGMGKTLLGFRLAEYLKQEQVPHINVPTPVISYSKLLEQMIIKFGWTPRGNDEESLQNQLLQYVNVTDLGGQQIVIIMDEIQDYDVSTLVNIRMLSNYNVQGFYPFQFILCGHPSFARVLANSRLEALDQRIRRRYTLEPFDLEETREYIYFRLIQSGAEGRPYFPDAAIKLIHSKSGGIPRVINNICDTCLLIGASQNMDVIDEDLVREAINFSEADDKDKAMADSRGHGAASERTKKQAEGEQNSGRSENKYAKTVNEDAGVAKRREPVDFTTINKKSGSSGHDNEEDNDSKRSGFLSRIGFKEILLGGVFLAIIVLCLIFGLMIGNMLNESMQYKPSYKTIDSQVSESARATNTAEAQKNNVNAVDDKVESKNNNQQKASENTSQEADSGISGILGILESAEQAETEEQQNAKTYSFDEANSSVQEKEQDQVEGVVDNFLTNSVDGSAGEDKGSRYSICLSVYNSRSKGEDVIKELQNSGLANLRLNQVSQNGEVLGWAVCHGSYTSRKEASEAKKKLDMDAAVIYNNSQGLSVAGD